MGMRIRTTTREAFIPAQFKTPGSMSPHSDVEYYNLYEIAEDGDEIECLASGTTADVLSALRRFVSEFPDSYYHVVALWTENGHTESEVVWDNLPAKSEVHESKNEATVNRITMRDVEKTLDKLQKEGRLDKALHELTAAMTYVGNHIANTDPDVRDNKLNSQERKIVARAMLKHVAATFGYQPRDLGEARVGTKYVFCFEEYVSPGLGQGRQHTVRIAANDDLDALKKFIAKHSMLGPCSSAKSVKGTLDFLKSGNGDGCDFVYYIKRPDGSYLFDSGEEPMEDWD